MNRLALVGRDIMGSRWNLQRAAMRGLAAPLPFEKPPFDHPVLKGAKEREQLFRSMTFFLTAITVGVAATVTYRSWWWYSNGKEDGIFDERRDYKQ